MFKVPTKSVMNSRGLKCTYRLATFCYIICNFLLFICIIIYNNNINIYIGLILTINIYTGFYLHYFCYIICNSTFCK